MPYRFGTSRSEDEEGLMPTISRPDRAASLAFDFPGRATTTTPDHLLGRQAVSR
ncbi:hypothetical protein ABGB08_36870 [Acrocarpospora sp. B8E8]